MNYFEKKKIKDILEDKIDNYKDVIVMGWVRTKRVSKNIAFIEINDGSTLKNLQLVILSPDEHPLAEINRGASIKVKGYLDKVEGREQDVEMKAEEIEIIGEAPEDFILQKKRHSFEFLREIAHLRARTNTFGVVNRFRSKMSYAVHEYFYNKDFKYIHTPIITSGDAEGAGEVFKVTTLDFDNLPLTDAGQIDYNQDFFAEETGLTVSGQLEAELLATALGDVYTFGPTFRAENSNTSRHASEFWMIEPEMAFCNLEEMMTLMEDFIKNLFKFAVEEAEEEMDFFNKWIDEGRRDMIKNIIESDFGRVTYTEAIEILENSDHDFEFPVKWGIDLQSEHERYLTEKHFQKPIMVYNYPKEIKAFYMRQNDDRKTVAAVDCLVPGVGEIIGGSQREERYEELKNRMEELNMDLEKYEWFLDIRKYGSVPHSGFGLGFERLLMYLSGMQNIRDVISFPRTPGSAKF
ncbi:asparagine--tRNA ligase [Halanaerobium congolense]|jgi:asparaginyl-tRNA synthetase|uniref:Asparagine--tRNA ligase n=1 Tax=Halanaerobium congolense TaxID=54121 RepID=A0A1G6I8X2_9FIRM|nr:asparagine--tRNA ligase [Halanaerobium congolense]KXS50313.1 MAG: asparaginyl-tRNA synthetase [Halanaerobium sp. T82-1]OEG62368.1 MAG: asparagine--tRNA ligase [Halanaerobium sp. MDAL1]PUU90449.1 MAG: asparaginyl-tRNA synthetase [Halanaerobium sp.]PTX17125.1 asparaginyl-tRNA synthetase [Halanaerobium congolense]TDP27186.1 asparaginyl-tRNA synthetase [Halanaerobium congolense]